MLVFHIYKLEIQLSYQNLSLPNVFELFLVQRFPLSLVVRGSAQFRGKSLMQPFSFSLSSLPNQTPPFQHHLICLFLLYRLSFYFSPLQEIRMREAFTPQSFTKRSTYCHARLEVSKKICNVVVFALPSPSYAVEHLMIQPPLGVFSCSKDKRVPPMRPW